MNLKSTIPKIVPCELCLHHYLDEDMYKFHAIDRDFFVCVPCVARIGRNLCLLRLMKKFKEVRVDISQIKQSWFSLVSYSQEWKSATDSSSDMLWKGQLPISQSLVIICQRK